MTHYRCSSHRFGPSGFQVDEMVEKKLVTPNGTIAYWTSKEIRADKPWLVFLPGLTANHRLFEKQIEHFDDKANVLVWDAPSHGESRPFPIDWSLDDLARWLKDVLDAEGIETPVLIGQSLGGFISQAFMDLYPGIATGFVSIDSAPLQRSYYNAVELLFLRHTKWMYSMFPWNTLVKLGAMGNSETPEGRQVMRDMMQSYSKKEYCELTAHGFRTLANAVAKDRPYEITCPTLLICGTNDNAGSMRRYCQDWEKRSDMKVHWIEGAGHASNCDAPEIVNGLIARFVDNLKSSTRGTPNG